MRSMSIAVIASASAIALTQIASAADLPRTAASTRVYLDRLLYRSHRQRIPSRLHAAQPAAIRILGQSMGVAM